jgi:hypothetical protein
VTHFVPARGLDEQIARRVAAPRVRKVAVEVERGAKVRAPNVHVWLTARDERVRPTHHHTDGQAIPANLRYKVRANDTDTPTMMRAPRDPSAPIEETANCRCQTVVDPDALRNAIKREDLLIVGAHVSQRVVCEFHRAAESERGTSEDKPARFMGGACHAVSRGGARR